jgi:Activator of Hsp90 ATPase homolog 1-like protein
LIEPLRLDFDVACPAPHAFAVWTADIARWWPADHTVSAEAGLTVVLEGRPGGRIFERTRDGTEHEWGEVTVWEPPSRFAYLWHLRRDRADATEVEIRFIDVGAATTRVEIEHRGWERLGADAETWRDRNRGGWATLLPHFIAAAAAPG